MVGATRSRVSFFMNRFGKMGFIHYAGGTEKSFANPQLPPQCSSTRLSASTYAVVNVPAAFALTGSHSIGNK